MSALAVGFVYGSAGALLLGAILVGWVVLDDSQRGGSPPDPEPPRLERSSHDTPGPPSAIVEQGRH